MSKSDKKTIEDITYKVNRGDLKSINEFKKFVGEEKFEMILQGFTKFDLTIEEDEYVKLLTIILDESEEYQYSKVPYQHTEDLVVFFLRTVRREITQASKIFAGWDIFFIAKSEQIKTDDADGINFLPDGKRTFYRCIELMDGDIIKGDDIYSTRTPPEFAELIGLKLASNKAKINRITKIT